MMKSYKLVGYVYYYEYNEETIDLLLGHLVSLFDWGNNKKLPEDVTFLNSNKEILLACNGHEFYYEISNEVEKEFFMFKNKLLFKR